MTPDSDTPHIKRNFT